MADKLPRLTPHQQEVFDRVARIQRRTGREVREADVGSPNALWHLIRKGWLVEGPRTTGPRGGIRYTYAVAPAAQRVWVDHG